MKIWSAPSSDRVCLCPCFWVHPIVQEAHHMYHRSQCFDHTCKDRLKIPNMLMHQKICSRYVWVKLARMYIQSGDLYEYLHCFHLAFRQHVQWLLPELVYDSSVGAITELIEICRCVAGCLGFSCVLRPAAIGRCTVSGLGASWKQKREPEGFFFRLWICLLVLLLCLWQSHTCLESQSAKWLKWQSVLRYPSFVETCGATRTSHYWFKNYVCMSNCSELKHIAPYSTYSLYWPVCRESPWVEPHHSAEPPFSKGRYTVIPFECSLTLPSDERPIPPLTI